MKETVTVYELRKRGFKVKVGHYRMFYRYNEWTGKRMEVLAYGTTHNDDCGWWLLSATGGKTEVCITDSKGNDYFGSTVCSNSDPYVKSFGRKKALLRAYASFKEENQGN